MLNTLFFQQMDVTESIPFDFIGPSSSSDTGSKSNFQERILFEDGEYYGNYPSPLISRMLPQTNNFQKWHKCSNCLRHYRCDWPTDFNCSKSAKIIFCSTKCSKNYLDHFTAICKPIQQEEEEEAKPLLFSISNTFENMLYYLKNL